MYISYGLGPDEQVFSNKDKKATGVVFKVVRITDYVTEPTYTDDLTTYLWDHISIRCICILNKDINAFPDGQVPSLSFNAIKNILRRPRQKLLVWQQDDLSKPLEKNYVLKSPLEKIFNSNTDNGSATPTRDANNGPRVVVHNLDAFHGNSSIYWDIEFQTDINECIGDEYFPPPLILSNRYKMRAVYDELNYRTAYEYRGEAIFRTDVLEVLKTHPDQYRRGLLPLISNGYQRHPIGWELNEGNSRLNYTVVDKYMPKSQPLNQKAGVAELFINEGRHYTTPFGLPAVFREVGEAFNDVGDVFKWESPINWGLARRRKDQAADWLRKQIRGSN